MWNYHSTLQCNVANYIVNCVYFGNKTTNPGTCARALALEMISLTSNDLKVSTETKAAQMGNLGFGVGLEILPSGVTNSLLSRAILGRRIREGPVPAPGAA